MQRMTFNKGDKVSVSGTVIDDEEIPGMRDYIRVRTDMPSGYGADLVLHRSTVVLVEPPPPVFKVGDWVRVKASTGSHLRGRTGRVTEAIDFGYRVLFDGKTHSLGFAGCELEASTMPEPSKGSVVLDKNGEAWQRSTAGPGYWRGSEGPYEWDTLLTSRGPVTVLHRGKSA